MEIKVGDWVKTPSGNTGRVEHIARLSAYVQFGEGHSPETLKAYLVSDLVKIDPPTSEADPPSGLHA
jgi:hypothetical protein